MEPDAHGPLGEDAPAERPKQTRRKKSRLGRLPSEITREELAMWFHLPAEEAAKVMRVSLTVLKRIARRHGVVRWPYRKVKSLTRALALPAASSAARFSAAAEAALPAGASQSPPQLQLLEQQIAAAAAAAATQGPHLQQPQPQPPEPLLLQAQPAAPPPIPAQLHYGQPAHGPGAQLLQAVPPHAPQLPQQWVAYHHQQQHHQHPQQPDATLSGNSQGSRLWGSAVGAAMEAHQQQHQHQAGSRESPRATLVRPVAQQWHPPSWQGATQQAQQGQHHQPPPAALEDLPPLPPELAAFRAARMAEAGAPVAAAPPGLGAAAGPAAAPQAGDSAGVTPMSADTRGIEVLLSAIEREEAGQEPVEQQRGHSGSSSRGGAPPASKDAAAPAAAGGPAQQQQQGAAAAASLAGEGAEEAIPTLGSAGSEGGSAGSSTNPAAAAAAAAPPVVSASTPVSPAPRVGASTAAGGQASVAELLERATGRLGLQAAGAGAGSDAEAAARLAVLAALRPASPARPPSPGANAWQAAGAAAADAAHHHHRAAPELQPSPFSARTHQAAGAHRSPSPPAMQHGALPAALELSLKGILARQQAAAAGAAGPPAVEQQQAQLAVAGSESIERLPTLEWPTVVAAGGPSPGAAPLSPRGLSAANEFSFGLQQAAQHPPSGPGAEGVQVAAVVGCKRAVPGAAAPLDAGSPAKRQAVGPAPPALPPQAAAALAGRGGSSEFNLGTIMALLRQAAGVQPMQEQVWDAEWDADRRQLLALLLASAGGQAAAPPQQPAPAPPPPPPARAAPTPHQAVVLDSLLRSAHWQQPSSQPLPQQAEQQAAAAPPVAAPAPAAAEAMTSLAALLRKLQRPASPSPFLQPAQPQPQPQPQPQLALPAQQRAPSPRAVVPEPVARFCLEKYARRLGYSIDSLALAMQAQQQAQRAPQQRQG